VKKLEEEDAKNIEEVDTPSGGEEVRGGGHQEVRNGDPFRRSTMQVQPYVYVEVNQVQT
jgi:hypothetical protein